MTTPSIFQAQLQTPADVPQGAYAHALYQRSEQTREDGTTRAVYRRVSQTFSTLAEAALAWGGYTAPGAITGGTDQRRCVVAPYRPFEPFDEGAIVPAEQVTKIAIEEREKRRQEEIGRR